jgi:eukaryotic-like serine/threonine-protein kinase
LPANGAGNLPSTAHIVLHRPLIPDADKESLALRQAAAATALLRLEAASRVWPLLEHRPDPRLRSYLLHRLAEYGVDPETLMARLAEEEEVSRRRALILGLGEFARAALLSEEQREALT